MAATKQFLLNYDSNILLPYTTLDCILGKESDNPDAGNTGITVITDKLLENIKEFIYNTRERVPENQINSSDISKAYVLGISTLKDGGAQVYTKFHELSLDSSVHAGHYLGADGTTHPISFTANSKDSDSSWYSTSITVGPSSNLDKPIKADVSINININTNYFDTSKGELYCKYSDEAGYAEKSNSSKYSEKASYAEKSNFAKYANKIGEYDASTDDINVIDIGSNIAVQLSNGNLKAIKNIGGATQPIYIDENGIITPFSNNVGSGLQPVFLHNGTFEQSDASIGSDNKKPIYLNNGQFTTFSNNVPTYEGTDGVGDIYRPTYIDRDGKVNACNYSAADLTSNVLIYAKDGQIHTQFGKAGAANQPVYLIDGKITAIINSIGDSHNPVYLENGVITSCTLNPSSISCTGVEGTQYLISDPSTGKGTWGPGNTTTAGSFDSRDGSVYYLVGINETNCVNDSFTHLTGAKKNNGTGIYFKDYELFQTSDENLKTFTGEIDINFDNLATIKKGIYYWTDDPNKISDIGIGARSLEALYPEIVDENDGVKTVAYNRLGVIALAAIDKLHLRVKELESEMKELKAEIRALKQGK